MRLSGSNRSTTSSCPVRSLKMSATGSGACGPGPGAASGTGSGASNPRKFSEKIALHTQRQAEETAAFQEVMMDITSTRVSLRDAGGRQALPGLAGFTSPLSPDPPRPSVGNRRTGSHGRYKATECRVSSAGFVSVTSLAQLANISMGS